MSIAPDKLLNMTMLVNKWAIRIEQVWDACTDYFR